MRGNVKVVKMDFCSQTIKSLSNQFVSLDIETTGLSKVENKIIEIGLVWFNNLKESDVFDSLLNIEREIPPFITHLTGITNKMIEDAPYYDDVILEVYKIFKILDDLNIIVVAHNASFDIGFIKEAFEKAGYFLTIRYIDTLQLSRKYNSGLINHKLQTVTSYYNIINDNAHRAVSDAKCCGEVLVKMIERHKI